MSCEIEHSGQICLCSMGFHAIMSSILSAPSFFRQKADCCPLTEDALGERSVYNSETGNLSPDLDVLNLSNLQYSIEAAHAKYDVIYGVFSQWTLVCGAKCGHLLCSDLPSHTTHGRKERLPT